MRVTAATVEDMAPNPWFNFKYEENVCGSEGFGRSCFSSLLHCCPFGGGEIKKEFKKNPFIYF